VALTALTLRSKAHWGYDAAFMAAASRELVITAVGISSHEVWVLEDKEGRVLGYHRVIPGDPAVLEDLWVEPDVIGTGRGRILLDHAVQVARGGGARALEFDADPNAVGFYERMGAVRIGVTPSTIRAGRELPRMRLVLE
jgi:GNAT superfamily N-acetyltransferase